MEGIIPTEEEEVEEDVAMEEGKSMIRSENNS